jgi:hypothetical protein
MKTYVGVKAILAVAMTLGEYNKYRGWEIPASEDPEAPGYLVEYDGSPSNAHPNHKNHISWSPKDVFEKSYRSIDGYDTETIAEAIRVWDFVGELITAMANRPKKVEETPKETFTCPRWVTDGGNIKDGSQSYWRADKTCSYCGSVSGEDFLTGLESGEYKLGTTSKNYKAYLHSVGGGMKKFYFHHLSHEQQVRFVELYNEGKIKFEGDLGFQRLPFFMQLVKV